MKKWKRNLLVILMCYISFYIAYGLLNLTTLNDQIVSIICLIFLILPAIMYNLIVKKENAEVTKTSSKIQKIIKLNQDYKFRKILKRRHYITEREYSRKSLDRVTASSIIKYHIENNIDSLRNDIENAMYNISLLEKYTKEAEEIVEQESNNESNYSLRKFKRIENRVLNDIIYKKEKFLVSLKLKVYYRSTGGNVNESRYGKFSFDQLINIYEQWENGNKFEETKRQERKIMNDDIRYNVLKRDNFTCKLCGASAKDGAKLHVDHIIPVSKGGKTVMSNLQTLCDRCNIGKSNKVDNNLEEDTMICPNCGGKLVKRKGKYGEFIGCSNYPKCTYKTNRKNQ